MNELEEMTERLNRGEISLDEYITFLDESYLIKAISPAKCSICQDTGFYTCGGSFGGATITQRCSCRLINHFHNEA